MVSIKTVPYVTLLMQPVLHCMKICRDAGTHFFTRLYDLTPLDFYFEVMSKVYSMLIGLKDEIITHIVGIEKQLPQDVIVNLDNRIDVPIIPFTHNCFRTISVIQYNIPTQRNLYYFLFSHGEQTLNCPPCIKTLLQSLHCVRYACVRFV